MANKSKILKGKFTYDVKQVQPWLRNKSSMKAWREVNGPDAIVFHWTGGSTLSSALNALTDKGLGYHFLINTNGEIIQGMPLNQRAPHAGYSWGPRGDTYTTSGGLNDYSIGISFVYTPEKNSKPISSAQITSAKELVVFLQSYFPNIKYVTTHFEITPARKGDIYFWGLESGGSSIGQKFVTSINSQHNLQMKFWKCGDDWVDKNNTIRTFKYATDTGAGGFNKNGVRLDGSARNSYTRVFRNSQIPNWRKSFNQKTTTFAANDVLGQ